MNPSLHPGDRLGDYLVESVVSWRPGRGLYRVRGSRGEPLLLKEMVAPLGLPETERERRGQRLEELAATLPSLEHPVLCRFHDAFWRDGRHYLAMEELPGSTLSTVLSFRTRLPTQGQVITWLRLLVDLVLYLERRDHPLAFEVLDPDRILIGADGQIRVFNLGMATVLDEFAWEPANLERAIHAFGRLVALMATGKPRAGPADLSPGLMWVVSRCLATQAQQCYHSFDQIQAALSDLLKRTDPSEQKVSAAAQPLTEFQIPVQSKPVPLATPRLLYLLALVLVLAGGLSWWYSHRLQPRDYPALAVAINDRLCLLNTQTFRWGPTLSLGSRVQSVLAAPSGDQAFLGLQSEIVEADTLWMRPLHSWSVGSPATHWLDPSGHWLVTVHTPTGAGKAFSVVPGEAGERLLQLKPRTVVRGGVDLAGFALPPSTSAPVLPEVSPNLGLLVSADSDCSLVQASTMQGVGGFPVSGVTSAARVGFRDNGWLLAVPARDELVGTSANLTSPEVVLHVAGNQPFELHADGRRVWCLNGGGSVSVLNAASLKVVEHIPLPGRPTLACLGARYLFVVLANPNLLAVIDRESLLVSRMLRLPGEASGLADLSQP